MLSAKFKSILLLIFCSCKLAAQTADSLTDLVNKASEQTKNRYYTPIVKGPNELNLLLAADSLARVNNNVAAQATINEELGYYYYMADPDKCIEYNIKTYAFYNELNNKKRAVQCFQNIAFAYDEQKHNFPEAAKYTSLAIQAQTDLKDTLSMANMYKYLGLLQGKMHEFVAAKKNEAEAIRLFTLKKFMLGAAVCYRDLAIVYEEEHNPDSIIINILKAKKIWMAENKDAPRLFDANNILIRAYTSQNKLHDAATVFHKNESMMNSRPMQDTRRVYSEVLDYYKTCQTFFSKKNDDKTAKEYLSKYNAYKETLKQQGYNVD